MIPWFWAIVGVVAGTLFGWFLCAICVSSKEAEEQQPRPKDRRNIK